jgi:hypothetical protein
LKNLKDYLKTSLNVSESSEIYRKIYDKLRSELINSIEMMVKTSRVEEHYLTNTVENDDSGIRYSRFSIVRRKFIEFLSEKDKCFGAEFGQTQIFLNYYNELMGKIIV